MLKIKYPTIDVAKFHDRYLAAFNTTSLNSRLATFFRSDPKFIPFRVNTATSILTNNLENLLRLSDSLNLIMTDDEKKALKGIFNYDSDAKQYGKKHQPAIAEFFMNNGQMELSSCFFCNIDFINSITEVSDYQNWNDFYNRGLKDEFMLIDQIGDVAATNIMDARANGVSLNTSKLNKTQISNFKQFKFKNYSNHFTLDHVLDKSSHPIAALSLYNFVPSCFSCNSKFKGSKQIVTNTISLVLSPTSDNFNFGENVRFKIFFPLAPTNTFLNITNAKDFVLNYQIAPSASIYETYIKAFKLRSRYIFHKHEAVKLIKKRKKYSDSQIRELAKIAKVSEDEFKKDIFGDELFSPDYNFHSLIKLKRDIAKDIGIKGVI